MKPYKAVAMALFVMMISSLSSFAWAEEASELMLGAWTEEPDMFKIMISEISVQDTILDGKYSSGATNEFVIVRGRLQNLSQEMMNVEKQVSIEVDYNGKYKFPAVSQAEMDEIEKGVSATSDIGNSLLGRWEGYFLPFGPLNEKMNLSLNVIAYEKTTQMEVICEFWPTEQHSNSESSSYIARGYFDESKKQVILNFVSWIGAEVENRHDGNYERIWDMFLTLQEASNVMSGYMLAGRWNDNTNKKEFTDRIIYLEKNAVATSTNTSNIGPLVEIDFELIFNVANAVAYPENPNESNIIVSIDGKPFVLPLN